MGQFISIETARLRPSQDFLKEGTLRFILTCISEGRVGDLPPSPIVRRGEGQDLIAIDGHNLVAIYDLLGLRCGVYVADSPSDFLTPEMADSLEGIESRNRDLSEKFESAFVDSCELANAGLRSFNDLREKYPYLESYARACAHFEAPRIGEAELARMLR